MLDKKKAHLGDTLSPAQREALHQLALAKEFDQALRARAMQERKKFYTTKWERGKR